MMNGHASGDLVLAGAASARPTPIVGRTRARVTVPLLVPPTITGRFGRAWLCDLAAARRSLPPPPAPDAMVAHWIVEAPWSHEVIHSYSLMLVHLRHMMGRRPPAPYLEGATHEICLYAIHPHAPRERMLVEAPHPSVWLEPMAFAAHFIAGNDDAAAERIVLAVRRVCEGALSPHPSHAGAWAEMFGDNMLRHARRPAPGASDEDAG